VNLELKIIIEQIRSLNQSITELEETIGKEGQKLEGHKNLTSIKGIGGPRSRQNIIVVNITGASLTKTYANDAS
jgi:hypothetical protein